MTKNPTPPNLKSTGIDPITDPILQQLDDMNLSADDDSAESVTKQARTDDLEGEYNLGGDNISPNVSLPDCEEDVKRTTTNAVPIIGFVEGNNVDDYCCGFVGIGRNSFCTKLRKDCQIGGHERSENKFEALPNRYYIHRYKTGTTAWCNPYEHKSVLQNIPAVLEPGVQKTLPEWKAVFDAAKSMNHNNNTTEDIIQHITNFSQPALDYSMYKTPGKATTRRYVEDDEDIEDVSNDVKIAMTYVKEEGSGKFVSNDAVEAQDAMEKLLVTVQYLLESYESLARTVRGKANLDDVANDVHNMTTSLAGLKSDVGSNIDSPYPDLWTAISELSTLTTVDSWDKIVSAVKLLQSQMILVEGHQAVAEERWKKLGKHYIPALVRHDKMVHKMSKYYIKMASKPTTTIDSMHELDAILDRSLVRTPSETQSVTSHSRKVEAKVNQCSTNVNLMQERLSRLENLLESQPNDSTAWDQNAPYMTRKERYDLGMTGVTYRNYYFKDINDLRTCMKREMEQPCHGLFVDIVSFWEFLGGERYVECNTTLNDLYLTSKVGFAAQSDAIVAGSFQNILPAALGKSPNSNKSTGSAELNSSAELLGIPTFSAWDARDGSTGRKYWVKRESRGAYKNLDGMQRHELSGMFQGMAHDTLIDSKDWGELLTQFISTSYEDSMNSGRFDEQQAWQMTCKFVKRIFTEIADARVIARNGIDIEDKWTTSARFIYGTLKAHEIMEEFARLGIKDHPSVSSEMVKFICYSQPATDTADIMSRLGNLETLQRGDQSAISRMETRVKRVETWKTDSDKTIKKLVDKHGI